MTARFDHHGHPRAKFSTSTHGNIIAIVDEDEGRSVTNDADAVIACLATNFDLSKYRVIYRDTCGIWDEMIVRDGRFADFCSINERDFDKALAKVESA
jgi:hypothetical protein